MELLPEFLERNGLDMATLFPEVTIKVGGIFYLPLIIDNPLETPIDVDLSVQAPEGWHVVPTGIATVGPHTRYFLRVQAQAPPAKLVGGRTLSSPPSPTIRALEKSAFASSFRLDGLLHSDLGFANEVRTLAHADEPRRIFHRT